MVQVLLTFHSPACSRLLFVGNFQPSWVDLVVKKRDIVSEHKEVMDSIHGDHLLRI